MTSTSSAPSLNVEAARYALLRRLAFAMRHEMVAHLQPIGMVSEVLGRRLRTPDADLKQLQDGVGRITTLARAAVQDCLDVITWIAPEAGRQVPLQEVVEQTVALLRSNFSFRGFSLHSELQEASWPVERAALRFVLPASLLLLTDNAGPPADIAISAMREGGRVRLRLNLEPSEGPEGAPMDSPYRALRGDEVAALAAAEDIGFAHEGDTITLDLRVAPAAES